MFFIFNLLVPLFRPSLFRVVLFFYISIYGSSHWRISQKFRKCHRKTPALESLLNKVAGLATPILKTSTNDSFWIYRGYFTLQWNDFKETYKWKNQFSRWQRVQSEAIFWLVNKKIKMNDLTFVSADILVFPETIFIVKNVYASFAMLVKKQF